MSMDLLPDVSQGNTGKPRKHRPAVNEISPVQDIPSRQSAGTNSALKVCFDWVWWLEHTPTVQYGNTSLYVCRLLAEIDATKIVSSLSADGILTVEAPVPETTVPEVTIIPIKVKTSGKFIYIDVTIKTGWSFQFSCLCFGRVWWGKSYHQCFYSSQINNCNLFVSYKCLFCSEV